MLTKCTVLTDMSIKTKPSLRELAPDVRRSQDAVSRNLLSVFYLILMSVKICLTFALPGCRRLLLGGLCRAGLGGGAAPRRAPRSPYFLGRHLA